MAVALAKSPSAAAMDASGLADLGPEHYVKLSPCLPQDACKDDAFKRMELRPDLDPSRAWSILGTHVGRDNWWQRWDGLERRRLRGVGAQESKAAGGGEAGEENRRAEKQVRYPGKVNPADLGPEHYVKLSPCLPQDACKDDAFKRMVRRSDAWRHRVRRSLRCGVRGRKAWVTKLVHRRDWLPLDCMELRPDLDPSRAWSILGTHVGRDNAHFQRGSPLNMQSEPMPPWKFTHITTNKPTKLRRRDQGGTPSQRPCPETQHDDHCQVYTDATIFPDGGRVSFLSSTHTCIQWHQRYTSQEADPLVMELQAIHDAIQAVTTKLPTIRHLPIFTDSLAAIRELKKVSKAMELCQRIHTLHRNTSTYIKVYWIQGHATNQYNLAADQQAHFPSDPDLPSLPLPSEPLSLLHARKHSLRQDTRALIPPCVCSLPCHLTRVEEVVLRRLRAGVALTPATRRKRMCVTLYGLVLAYRLSALAYL
ncbi:hypothetical protein HPB47_002583 [Ixodes persulcatus]|uniref:Uncharacterized protein n=1 Tax=Ixodes persulcatus TaxID=34615 RepID=A0AC60PKW1_IXOPE|nr:hypothetical protein HPB47_002583 [Ixodes persulcatus]